MQTTSPYLAHLPEAILRARVMALIALYASAAKRARAEKHPRIRELRWAHCALIETRLIVTAETLFEEPMQDFEAVVRAHHGTLH